MMSDEEFHLALVSDDEGEEDEREGYNPGWMDPRTGQLRIMSERCSTCIFRPGNLMSLNPGRMADLMADCDANDTNVVCHQTLGRGLGEGMGAMCRGSFDRRPGQLVRIFGRLSEAIKWVDPNA